MKKNISLSIIIPNYNKSPFIGETLASILRQTVLPNEIIVIDDCSTDNSREVIENFAKKSPIIKTIFLLENSGVQNARNVGIKCSSSEYVCFVDSDDIYLRDDCIEQQLRYVGKNKLVGVYQMIIDENSNITSLPLDKRIKKRFMHHPVYWFQQLDNFMAWPWHYIVKKDEVLKTGGFDNPYSLYEDSEMIIKLVLNGLKPIWINIEGKGYRLDTRCSHLSKRSDEDLEEAKQYIRNKYKRFMPIRDKIYGKAFELLKRIFGKTHY